VEKRELAHLVSADEFRSVLALFPSGVTVVTRRLSNDRPYGMTVSSFTSVSLRPPLVLVCIDKSATFISDLPPRLPLAINMLSEDQQALAVQFAERRDEDRFRDIEWFSGWKDVPILKGTVAAFLCSLEQSVEAGDHLILIARVHEISQHEGRSLVWCERSYHCLPPPPDQSSL
jgi:flavin reductase ActVB